MITYKITHISCMMIFKHVFAAGTCIGGGAGVVFGILERDAVGILGGAFLGLLFGLVLGLFSMLCAETFNVLVPYLGGIPIELEEVITPQPQQPATGSSIEPPGSDQASGL